MKPSCRHDPVDIRLTRQGARCYCGRRVKMAELAEAARGDGPWSSQTLKLVAACFFRASA